LTLLRAILVVDGEAPSVPSVMLPRHLRSWGVFNDAQLLSQLVTFNLLSALGFRPILESPVGLYILPLFKLRVILPVIPFDMNVVHQILSLLPHLNLTG
jgi:hypothetical protein